MKILTKEEEAAHYRATLSGGTVGLIAGLGVGYAGVALASRRYHFVRTLTLPLKAFLVTSAGTFAGIIAADHSSRSFETQRNPKDREFQDLEARRWADEHAGMSFTQRALEWGRRERYKIVGGSWIASMATAWALVNRNQYLSGAQKLVQARVYAQFLTLGVLVATAAFEISDSHNEEGKLWETRRIVDPKDPEGKRIIEVREEKDDGKSDGDDLWKSMVEAEEEREREQDEEKKELQKKHGKKSDGKEDTKGKKSGEKKDDKKDDAEQGEKEDKKGEKKNEKQQESKKDEKKEKEKKK